MRMSGPEENNHASRDSAEALGQAGTDAVARGQELAPRRVLVSTLVGLALLVAGVVLLATFARESLMSVSRAFVEVLGGAGVALGFFLPDAFTVPLPNDVASMFGLAGGLSFWSVVAWASLGSLVGGSVGYLIGWKLGRTRVLRTFFEGRGRDVFGMLQRRGLVVVVVAAITPLPYSIACWAAGASQLPFRRFFLVSQLRILRIAGYLYLIELGLVSSGLH
jgi:membrane protein YqaA with SNARE-associated domain